MKIVCCGDSNTCGFDPRSPLGERYPAQERWVDALGSILGCETVNLGLNGREIPRHEGELNAVCELLQSLQGDVLLVMLGSNDLLQGADAHMAGERMERFLLRLKQSGEKPVLVVPPPMQAGSWTDEAALQESRKLSACYSDAAERLQIPVADAGEWGIGLCFDGVHFTEAGHRRFAEALAKFLRERNAESGL